MRTSAGTRARPAAASAGTRTAEPPPSAAEPLLDHVSFVLTRAYYTYLGLLERVLAETRLGKQVQPGMGHILFSLFAEDDLTLKDLVERVQLSYSALSGMVARMKRAKLIACRRDVADGRLVRIRLTPLGKSLEPRCRAVLDMIDEVMLLDAGSIRTADRLLAFMEQNNIHKIDYLVVSHFEGDHMGGVPRLAERIPIRHFVDHGENVTYAKDDNWWRARRGPWMRGPGWGRLSDQMFDAYCKARDKSDHIVAKAGDRLCVTGLDVIVVSAAGKVLEQPLPGAGAANPACAQVQRRADDDAEDAQSVGVLVQLGKFRFIDLGDLDWNVSYALFCPKNLVGTVDAYLVTHHGQSLPRKLGEYYYGLSSCSPAEVFGLNPRVALLTMGAQGHKEGTPEAMQTVLSVPGMDLWQTERIVDGGEKGYNGPEPFIANVGEESAQVPYIGLTACADGSFTVVNSRNGYVKKYPSGSSARGR